MYIIMINVKYKNKKKVIIQRSKRLLKILNFMISISNSSLRLYLRHLIFLFQERIIGIKEESMMISPVLIWRSSGQGII